MAGISDRVNDDLKAGRLWKARDRLLGLLRVEPANQWALNQLGDIYFRMNDLPQAGRIWFLSEREGPEWEAAEAAFYERYGRRPAEIVAALNVRSAIDHYPSRVQERLSTLQRRLQAEGRFWEPRDRASPMTTRRTIGDRFRAGGGLLILAVLLIALGVGFYNVVIYLIHLIQAAR